MRILPTILALAVLASVSLSPSKGQQTVIVQDVVGDAQIRRADPGADGPIDTINHIPPDLVSYEIGKWAPTDAKQDRFTGTWSTSGLFFRLDLVFNGLASPPGTLGIDFPFDPFKYGPNPVFGYVEFDMDTDVATGGELDSPDLRYLGNAARNGGLPTQSWFVGRAAQDSSAFDGNLATPPQVDRSGEEFHIAFYGWEIGKIEIESGDLDLIFEPDESWEVEGELFHRAHGFEPFSFACCSGSSGSYEPEVYLLWTHSSSSNQTTVSLVYPLTNAGSAALTNDPVVEPNDGDRSNQNSVLEALDDLQFSASNPCCGWTLDPDWPVIAGWAAKDPNQHLDPLSWRINVLVATSYTIQDPDSTLFVWSDLMANMIPGDFDGSGNIDQTDVGLFDAFVSTNDGLGSVDEDGLVNGTVDIINFGPDFSLFDVNYDGFVDQSDRPLYVVPADRDQDGDVDTIDFAVFASCFNKSGNPPRTLGCSAEDAGAFDSDSDNDVDTVDFAVFASCFNKSGNPPRTLGCPGP